MAIVKLYRNPPAPDPAAGINSLADLQAFIRNEDLDRAPLDVSKVAERLGIQVRLESMADDMSGFLERRGDNWLIGVNQYHAPVRQRFTIAHEIAHFALHRNQKSSFHDKTFARRSDSLDPMERAADQFAAELLMPKESVISSIDRGIRNLAELATQFSVSAIAMKYRLNNLGFHLT